MAQHDKYKNSCSKHDDKIKKPPFRIEKAFKQHFEPVLER